MLFRRVGSLGLGLAALSFLAGACDTERPAPTGNGPSVVAVTTTGSGGSSAGGSGGDGGAAAGGAGTAAGGSAAGGAGGAGPENCFDGVDNDEDTLIDCLDDDCSTVCTDACTSAQPIGQQAPVFGQLLPAVPSLTGASCGAGDASAHVYTTTATETGVTNLLVTQTGGDVSLSVRTDCGNAGSELSCSNIAVAGGNAKREYLSVPVTAGDQLFVVVQAAEPGGSGAYVLVADNHAITCGDSNRDGNEECDDGNMVANDGCTGCMVDVSETEPNDTLATANPFVDPWFAEINPSGDSDHFSIPIPGPNYSIIVSVQDLGDGSCPIGQIDSYLALFGATQGDFLGGDDDSGDGFCSRVSARNLPVGLIHARVRASAKDISATFGYRILVELDECGNGVVGGSEGCDDGNLVSGDGCSSGCATE